MTNPTQSGESVTYQKDTFIEMYGDPEKGCDEKTIATNYDALTKSVEVGQIILIDEGLLKLEVTEVSEDVNYV
jgi:pyruvate kinase